MIIDTTKTEIEKQLVKSENKNEILNERIEVLEKQIKVIAELMKRGKVVVESGC
jgi:hypothetical protein